MSQYIVFTLAVCLLFSGCSFNTKNVSKTENTNAVAPVVQPTEKDVYTILKVEQKKKQLYATIASSTMLSGNTALQLAIQETGCPEAKITDGECAPSLNNGFYISRKLGKELTLPLSKNVEVFLVQGTEPVQMTGDQFFNLFTQTDAFSLGENRTPFLIEVVDGQIKKVEQQYIP